MKVAGLFFSKKKCPTQAKPYPTKGMRIKSLKSWNKRAAGMSRSTNDVPIKCKILLVEFLCSVK